MKPNQILLRLNGEAGFQEWWEEVMELRTASDIPINLQWVVESLAHYEEARVPYHLGMDFVNWASQFCGWDDGPVYAPFAIMVEQEP